LWESTRTVSFRAWAPIGAGRLSNRFPEGPLLRKSALVLLFGAVATLLEPPAGSCQEPVSDSARTVRPGDVIRLRIWREPEWSGEFPVDIDGSVIFPRVGRYDVVRDTPETLRERLLADYQQFLRNPSIEITVLRRVRIIGAVNEPGLHLVDPTITVADALAMAGGATPIGEPDKIRIIRDGVQIAVDIRQNTRIGDSPIQSGDQILVPERSWVSRNAAVVAATITASVSLVIALFIR
jgi:polysaccharide export outer membrane protein